MRGRVVDRKRISAKREKSVCAKRHKTENRDNLVVPQCAGSWT